MAVGDSTGNGNGPGTTRLALRFPEDRELLWIRDDAPIVGWQVGDVVSFRNTEWCVVWRSEADDSVTLTLATPEEARSPS